MNLQQSSRVLLKRIALCGSATVAGCLTFALSTAHAAAPFNLNAAISAAHVGQTIECPTNSTIDFTNATITTSGLTIHGNGSTLVLPNSFSVFDVRAANVTIDGFIAVGTVAKPIGTFVLDEADNCTLSNCKLGTVALDPTPTAPGHGKWTSNGLATLEQGFKTQMGGTNGHVINCVFGKTVTVGAYFDQDGANLSQCFFCGCENEYDWRLECDVHKQMHSNAFFVGCEFLAPDGSKDGGGARLYKNFTMNRCVIHKDFRLGEDPPSSEPPTTLIDQYVTATIINCKFVDQEVNRNAAGEVSGGLQYIECYEGTSFEVADCSFACAGLPAITVGQMSQCTTTGKTATVQSNNVVTHVGNDKSLLVAVSSKGKWIQNP